MSGQDDEFKTVRLEERTRKGLDELLAKEKEEGWVPRLPPALGFAAPGVIFNHAISSGTLRLERSKNWLVEKEIRERIKKEITMPTPLPRNDAVIKLQKELDRIRNQMQMLEQRESEIEAEIAKIRSGCKHSDWKYVGCSDGMFPVRVCKECGEEDINTDIIIS